MCKPATQEVNVEGPTASSASSSSSSTPPASLHHQNKLRILYSIESFRADEHGRPPPRRALMLTVALVVLGLCASELLWRWILAHPVVQQYVPVVLHVQQHRQIVARHVGVDALACFLCSLLGYMASSSSSRSRQNSTTQVACTTMEQRLLTYHPAAFRIATVFLAYQVKNLHDSYVWNDGIEFLFHHVFSIITAWGSLYPGCGHYYVIFFFGMSEISTAVLCLLANFDPKYGVPGLDSEYPTIKLALGGLFILCFIICRCILWPMYSYDFGKDVLLALKQSSSSMDERTHRRKYWMYFFLISLSGLSVLQVAWLGQILIIAKQELDQMGLL